MDAKKFAELADVASSLAGRALTVDGPEYGPWYEELRGFVEICFPDGRVPPDIAAGLDPKSVGRLSMQARTLFDTRSLSGSGRPKVQAALLGAFEQLRRLSTAPVSAVVTTGHDVGGTLSAWEFLDERLGSGGQGSVVRVWHKSRFVHGALKRLRSDKPLTDKAKARFLREIEVFRSVKSPFVLKVLDSGNDTDGLFLVTEVARFGSLKDNASIFTGDVWRTLRLARDIARGLAPVHDAGVVHRDLKPENLLLHSLDHPVVGDFGIAHLADKDGLTSTNERVGSFWFSPREYEMKDEPTAAFDVFSLGAIVHWVLSGAPKLEEPYRAMRERVALARVLNDDRLGRLDRLLDSMMMPEAKEWIGSMNAVIAAIDAMLGGGLARGPAGSRCLVCGSGTYEAVGELRASGGTEITAWQAGGTARGLFHLRPELSVCNGCGDMRLRALSP